MDRLDGFLTRHRRTVLVVWILLVAASIPFAMRQTEQLTSGGFTVPGSGSLEAEKALERFDGVQPTELAVVVRRGKGTAADVRRHVERIDEVARELDGVALTARVREQALARAERPIQLVPLQVTVSGDDASDLAVDVRDELGIAEQEGSGTRSYLVGGEALWAGMQDLSKEDLEAAERTGFPVVLLILLAVFGSLAAAALPLALGFASVIVTGAGIWLLAQQTDMSVFVTNVASMIGIGVAVDYSLFVLARYREEIAHGASTEEARRISLRTSGLAVAFSGLTVIVSLAGLWVVNAQTIRSMAMGAILVVAVSVVAAVTLLPVLIRLFGTRVYSRDRFAHAIAIVLRAWRSRPRRRGSTHPERERRDFWERWTERVTRRPWLTAAASAAVLIALAAPATGLEWGQGALPQFPEDNETRVGAELAAEITGPGATGPVQVVAQFREGNAESNRAAVAAYVDRLERHPAVARVEPPRTSRDGRAVLIAAIPREDPESPRTYALVDRLREDAAAGRGELARAAEIDIGGVSAYERDFRNQVEGSMWKILLFVMVFSYVVLLVLLRSVLLPLKAVLMNLLSVGAAYGVLVVVFQWGWFDGFMGFESLGYINTLTPPFLLAITFGLSMDYEVFLLTRIRERYEATHDNARAVAEGLRASAKTISSAALIMVAVFAVFAGTGVPSVKEIGLGLAVAIAVDATLVRLVLVPATMELMGRWNWWLPRRLDRVLPQTAFEAPARAGT